MATPTADFCRLCGSNLPKKQRRTIFSETFRVESQLANVLGYVAREDDGNGKYVCFSCYGKLNTLSKIDFDLKTKMSTLRNSRETLLNELKSKCIPPSKGSINTDNTSTTSLPSTPARAPSLPIASTPSKAPNTPSRAVFKRTIIHTPTPRKPKKLFSKDSTPGPAKPSEGSSATGTCSSSISRSRKRLGEKLLSPNKAKVVFRSGTETRNRTRIITEKGWYHILVSLVRGATKKTVQCIKLLSQVGVSVGPSAMQYKQNELVKRQKDKIKLTIGKQVQQEELIDKSIYQEFYKTSSAADQGTLFQLRNVVHRVDVKGSDSVIDNFRAHFAFIEDCLDSYILAAAMEVLGLDNLDQVPAKVKPPPLLETLEVDDQYKWLLSVAKQITDCYIKFGDSSDLTDIRREAEEMDNQMRLIQEMFDVTKNRYVCACNKTYKTIGFLKRHLTKEHNWLFQVAPEDVSKKKDDNDYKAIYRASFMKNALILRDTYDAYRMGDGNRIYRNAKFEMLCADVRQHYKYRLWLWRFQAYIVAILTPKQSMEYKWNCSANTKGGVGENIPNDNLVELNVHLVKKRIKEQGGNFTYESAKKAALAVQVQDDIRRNFAQQVSLPPKGTGRSITDKSKDIGFMLNELINCELFKHEAGRKFEAFRNIKDIYERVKLPELHKWISQQKEIASYEMI